MTDASPLTIRRPVVDTQTSFVSLTKAVERKGVHYKTMRWAIRWGNLAATKIGEGVLVAVADLDRCGPSMTTRHGCTDGLKSKPRCLLGRQSDPSRGRVRKEA